MWGWAWAVPSWDDSNWTFIISYRAYSVICRVEFSDAGWSWEKMAMGYGAYVKGFSIN